MLPVCICSVRRISVTIALESLFTQCATYSRLRVQCALPVPMFAVLAVGSPHIHMREQNKEVLMFGKVLHIIYISYYLYQSIKAPELP